MIEVYTDGASSGHPGISGAGIYIKAEGKQYEYSIPLPVMDNHEAEFHAIIKALENCQRDFPGQILSFRSDSQTAVQAINRDYTKNKIFQPLLDMIREKSSSFPYFFIKWISEKENHHADQLARKAIQQQR